MKNTLKKNILPFTQVSNELLNDTEITLKAKGLYAFMLSKPSNWNFTIKSMSKQLKEGTESIMNALKELKNKGWIIYTKQSDGYGVYELLYSPKTDNQDLDEPKPENPNQAFPKLGKPECINNKDYINNKDLYIKETFLKDWNKTRSKILGKQSNFNRLKIHDITNLKDICKYYDRETIINAMIALFKQENAFDIIKINPTHFLENFETYKEAFNTKNQKIFKN